MFLPAASVRDWAHAGATLLGAFLLFRVFDILKPWPANQLQALPKGWGILADDLAAGVQALLVVQLLTRTLMG
jgi:phosphatidylglycerophosphatase A